MRTIIKVLLIAMIFTLTSLFSIAFADDDVIKFKLEIKPNQQKVEAKIDGDEHKQIQIRAEYVKLNTVTNNYHIKVTITNNSGQILYHQLALIDKVEHSEVKYPDSITEYIKNDDGKQITKALPYYNYGNIKPNQATPREWYLSNTGKDEIEVEGYIINKEIPVVLDPKIAAANPGVAQTLTAYLTALRDNDLDGVLATVANLELYSSEDQHKKTKNAYMKDNGILLKMGAFGYSKIKAVSIRGDIATFEFLWNDPNDGSLDNLDIVLLANFGSPHGWLLIEF